jgi:DNA-binding NarL/FixJ family response regulator
MTTPLFREGLRFLLSKIEMVNNIYEAENGAVFLDGLDGRAVDLVLMDIEMPVIGGV